MLCNLTTADFRVNMITWKALFYVVFDEYMAGFGWYDLTRMNMVLSVFTKYTILACAIIKLRQIFINRKYEKLVYEQRIWGYSTLLLIRCSCILCKKCTSLSIKQGAFDMIYIYRILYIHPAITYWEYRRPQYSRWPAPASRSCCAAWLKKQRTTMKMNVVFFFRILRCFLT